DRAGRGWAVIHDNPHPPRLDGGYVRDEAEQVRYLEELNAIFAEEGVDLAFWFTFAGYPLVHDSDPLRRFRTLARLRSPPRPGHGQLWSGEDAARPPRHGRPRHRRPRPRLPRP